MTVKELQEKLNKFPDDMEVYFKEYYTVYPAGAKQIEYHSIHEATQGILKIAHESSADNMIIDIIEEPIVALE